MIPILSTLRVLLYMYLHSGYPNIISVTSQLIALNDGTSYNSVEIVWNAEPKSLVHMYPYILAFTANTVEIRMASNGSLMQTIQVPDLHLISMKVQLHVELMEVVIVLYIQPQVCTCITKVYV